MTVWIDELERDLGLSARLRLIANAGGQRRDVPTAPFAVTSALAAEVGADIVVWLADRFGGHQIDIPSGRGAEIQRRASLLRAAVLEAGLTKPTRSANDLAREHGVTSAYIHKLRSELRREAGIEPQQLSLFG